MIYYAVHNGRIPGIYKTWDECQSQVKGFSTAKFKKFKLLGDAEYFYQTGNSREINTINTSNSREINTINTSNSINTRNSRENNTNNSIDTNSINIYTDGSLVKKQDTCGCGYGIYIPKQEIRISNVLANPKTNNRAELTAIIEAIKLFNEDVILNIYTDSKYSILICTGTGIKYQKNNFKTKNNQGGVIDVINRDLIEIVLTLLVNRTIKFTHIPAHTRLKDEHSVGNNIADKLALEAATTDFTLA